MRKKAELPSQISDDPSQPSDDQSEQSAEQKYLPRIDRNLYHQPDLQHVVINTAFTNYPIIREVARKLGMLVIDEPEERYWDVCWTDHPITPQTFIRMHFHQTINYLPGIHTIARKNQLGHRLNKMQAQCPNQYQFHPATWMLPEEFSQLRKHMEGPGRGSTYIVKPQADCQGRGIYLVNRLDDIVIGKHCVVQKYIDNPLLIDGYKFDLRVYVLIGSLDPLRIYIYHDGLVRFATEAYQPANINNYRSAYQHLTNYAINKFNPKFKQAQSGMEGEGGFKRSLKGVFTKLADDGVDTARIWSKIEEIAIKTIILGYEKMRNNYVSSQPEQYHNHMAFHIIGLDIFIDSNYEPYLIQVNHTPSFATQTHLDYRVKHALIKDTLILMNCNDLILKQQLYSKSKIYSTNRMSNGVRQTLQEDVRATQLEEQLQKRIKYEETRMGGYTLIFPCQSKLKANKYSQLIIKAQRLFAPKKMKVTRKVSITSQHEVEKSKNKAQLKPKQSETIKTKNMIRSIPKQQQQAILKQKLKFRRHNSIYSERTKLNQNLHETLINYIKTDLALAQNMTRSSIPGSTKYNLKQNKTFTIKKKLSIPEVVVKKPCLPFERNTPSIQKEISATPTKEGNFIKPKNYDVLSLETPVYFPEEHRIVKKKNREGRTIFHIPKS